MGSFDVTAGQFSEWLRSYQSAWEGRDPSAAAKLFADDARYHWTPLVPPQQGPAEIAAAWAAAVDGQRDIRFTFEVFGYETAQGLEAQKAYPFGRERHGFVLLSPDGKLLRCLAGHDYGAEEIEEALRVAIP